MRIAVLGTGYVGLVSAACLAELGHSVTAVDIDPARIELLRQGGMPLYEPGLAPLVAVHQATGQLGFTVDLGLALRDVDVVMIAIGTPPGSDGQADVSAVLHAAQAVGQQLQQAAVLVMKSTVPVGTSERVQALVQAQLKQRGLRFRVPVVSNPEFLREGTAVRDFLHPDRVIVGAARRADSELMHVLYGPLVARGVPLLVMDLRSAELTKYAANVMLAARISLINEIACIAEGAGADIEQVRLGLGSDKRLGPDFLRAGIGYGGSCFPKDVQALAQIAESVGQPARMLKAVHQVNEQQKRRLFERMVAHYGGAERLRGKRVAVWGLAFKPGTDDLREAPSLRGPQLGADRSAAAGWRPGVRLRSRGPRSGGAPLRRAAAHSAGGQCAGGAARRRRPGLGDRVARVHAGRPCADRQSAARPRGVRRTQRAGRGRLGPARVAGVAGGPPLGCACAGRGGAGRADVLNRRRSETGCRGAQPPLSPMKASIASATRSGCSTCGRWPASSTSSNLAPGTRACSSRA